MQMLRINAEFIRTPHQLPFVVCKQCYTCATDALLEHLLELQQHVHGTFLDGKTLLSEQAKVIDYTQAIIESTH